MLIPLLDGWEWTTKPFIGHKLRKTLPTYPDGLYHKPSKTIGWNSRSTDGTSLDANRDRGWILFAALFAARSAITRNVGNFAGPARSAITRNVGNFAGPGIRESEGRIAKYLRKSGVTWLPQYIFLANVNDEELQMLLFADDVLPVADDTKNLQCSLNELNKNAKKTGLSIDNGKTKWMKDALDSENIEHVENTLDCDRGPIGCLTSGLAVAMPVPFRAMLVLAFMAVDVSCQRKLPFCHPDEFGKSYPERNDTIVYGGRYDDGQIFFFEQQVMNQIHDKDIVENAMNTPLAGRIFTYVEPILIYAQGLTHLVVAVENITQVQIITLYHVKEFRRIIHADPDHLSFPYEQYKSSLVMLTQYVDETMLLRTFYAVSDSSPPNEPDIHVYSVEKMTGKVTAYRLMRNHTDLVLAYSKYAGYDPSAQSGNNNKSITGIAPLTSAGDLYGFFVMDHGRKNHWRCIAMSRYSYSMLAAYKKRAHLLDAMASYSKDPAGIRDAGEGDATALPMRSRVVVVRKGYVCGYVVTDAGETVRRILHMLEYTHSRFDEATMPEHMQEVFAFSANGIETVVLAITKKGFICTPLNFVHLDTSNKGTPPMIKINITSNIEAADYRAAEDSLYIYTDDGTYRLHNVSTNAGDLEKQRYRGIVGRFGLVYVFIAVETNMQLGYCWHLNFEAKSVPTVFMGACKHRNSEDATVKVKIKRGDYMLYFPPETISEATLEQYRYMKKYSFYGVKGCTLFIVQHPEDVSNFTASDSGCDLRKSIKTFMEQSILTIVQQDNSTRLSTFRTGAMFSLERISEPLLMNFEDSWFSDPIITAPNTFSSSFARANNYYFLTDPGANPDKCNLNYRRRQLTRERCSGIRSLKTVSLTNLKTHAVIMAGIRVKLVILSLPVLSLSNVQTISICGNPNDNYEVLFGDENGKVLKDLDLRAAVENNADDEMKGRRVVYYAFDNGKGENVVGKFSSHRAKYAFENEEKVRAGEAMAINGRLFTYKSISASKLINYDIFRDNGKSYVKNIVTQERQVSHYILLCSDMNAPKGIQFNIFRACILPKASQFASTRRTDSIFLGDEDVRFVAPYNGLFSRRPGIGQKSAADMDVDEKPFFDENQTMLKVAPYVPIEAYGEADLIRITEVINECPIFWKRRYGLALILKLLLVDLLLTILLLILVLVHRMYIIPKRRRSKIRRGIAKAVRRRKLRQRAKERLAKLAHPTEESSSEEAEELVTAAAGKGDVAESAAGGGGEPMEAADDRRPAVDNDAHGHRKNA
uniref:Sema domain-containing protein n=1 Tax=Ascaris lumbricoides TaxID=6252 RepID=A0A0M3HWE2_ASCLU